jgi:DNA polymerase III subunit epsilon
MFEGPAVFVDIETNGGNGESGRITEIALLRVEGGEITEQFSSLVNPGAPIPYWITKLTGITNSDLAQAPYFDDIAENVHRIMEGAIFVAHNVRFDFSFVKRQLESCGYVFRPKLFCTVRLSRAIYPEHKGHSLQKIIERHSIEVNDRHRAYDDAKAIYDFTRLSIQEKGRERFDECVAVQLKTKTLPPNIDEAAFAALPQAPGVYIFEDASGKPLYVGKSVNIRQRVMSHFASDTRIAKEMKQSLGSHNLSFIETDTELEALLLESAKIKELQPLHNRLLRRQTKQTVLMRRFTDDGYLKMALENRDLNELTNLDDIYGVYTSKSKAKTSLEALVKTFSLCPKLMDLEKSKAACFRYHLGFCKGACVGKEPKETYNRRVELALERSKLDTWPFKGELAVPLNDTKALIIDQWVVKGYLTAIEDGSVDIQRLENGFDIDTYKIIRGHIRKNKSKVFELSGYLASMNMNFSF